MKSRVAIVAAVDEIVPSVVLSLLEVAPSNQVVPFGLSNYAVFTEETCPAWFTGEMTEAVSSRLERITP